MFSFFRRSKRDPKDSSREHSATPDTKDTCKNNSTTQKRALQGSLTSLPNSAESGLRENPADAAASEVTALREKNDPIPKTAGMSDEKSPIAPVIPAPPTVCFAPRKIERSSPGVKPCGHGTTAISPHFPPAGKDPRTPPPSPKLEDLKKPPRFQRNPSLDSASDQDIPIAKGPAANVPAQSPAGPVGPLVNGTTGGDAEKKNLINQEAKFQSQLNDLSKQLSIRDAEANKLRFQMEELQRDVFVKSAGMDRLQAELQAAYKESEITRQRIRHLESDLAEFREKNSQISEELTKKSGSYTDYEKETNAKIAELEGVIKELKAKIESLEAQLESLRQEKEQLEQHREVLLAEREEEKKKVAEVLEHAALQKQEIERKWKQDFEKLRTINIMKEQQLLDDFEWKLREVQQTCKKRLEEKDKTIEERLQEAYKEAELKMKEAEDMMAEVETMKSYEMEIEQLRGLTENQEKALKEMKLQQEQMRLAEESLKGEAKRLRNLIEMEKENLQHMQRVHHQEILDKERTLKQTLHQKRTEIAMYWEERLLHECGRLKSELEQIHNEEKHFAMETVRREKGKEFQDAQRVWEKKLKDCLKEIDALKRSLDDKDEHYHDEMIRTQTNTDRDLLELRRLMDKIDLMHHERFEKLVQEHEEELERINEETESRIKEVEANWESQVTSLRTNLELVKEQMERESQQKIESLIEQHRTELDVQWDNLIQQKSEAVQLVEDEYVTKYKTLEEQFFTQQKSHEAREIELLKTIDSLKNELSSKDSAIDDLQNNVDTLEGGIQVLNEEVASQGDQITKTKKEADLKIRGLQEAIAKLQEQQEQEREAFRLKMMGVQKQSQDAIDHLQRKCQCLTKLFEEVRLRYERRESRQEDLNIISDLRQVIAEQEKDLACLNEEKRYFQMRLINLENRMEDNNASGDDGSFEDAVQSPHGDAVTEAPNYPPSGLPPAYPMFTGPATFSIPPTIPECDE